MRELYSLEVNKKGKREVKTPQEDGSYIVNTVEDVSPVKIIFNKISRRNREELNLVYNAELQKCISRGVGSVEILRKSLLGCGGGGLADADLELRDVLVKEHELVRNKVLEKSLEKQDVTEEMKVLEEIEEKIKEIEGAQFKIFNQSADSFARIKYMTWCALMLTSYENGNDVFPGSTFESKLQEYYDMEDRKEDGEYVFELDVFVKAYYVYTCFAEHGLKTKEEFDKALELLDE